MSDHDPDDCGGCPTCEACAESHHHRPGEPCPEDLRNYEVFWRATGSVVVRAHDIEEAEELANERFGITELAHNENAVVDGLEYGYRYGPETEPTEQDETPHAQPTPAPTPPL